MRLLSYAVRKDEDRLAVGVGVDRVVDVERLIRSGLWSMARLLPNARVCVLPEGPQTIPFVT